MRVNTVIITAAMLLLCFASFSFAAGLQGKEAQKDLEKLQGTWVLVGGEWNGKKLSDENVAKSKITWKGNNVTLVTPHQNKEPIIAEIVKIDTTKSPKEMHFVRKNGPSAGKTRVAVYEFDGDDIYHFAFDPSGATTPKQLAGKEKTGHLKHTWKRVKR